MNSTVLRGLISRWTHYECKPKPATSENTDTTMQTENKDATAKVVIAFLGFREFDQGQAYRGAILVTD